MKQEPDRNTLQTRYGKTRLRSLDDLDGRTSAAQHARQLVLNLENDLGGHNALSVGVRELVKRVALCGALLEDCEVRWLQGEKIDTGDYATLCNAQRRLLVTVGIDRIPRDVTDIAARQHIEQLWDEVTP
jgi:hypothetical protein